MSAKIQMKLRRMEFVFLPVKNHTSIVMLLDNVFVLVIESKEVVSAQDAGKTKNGIKWKKFVFVFLHSLERENRIASSVHHRTQSMTKRIMNASACEDLR